MAEQENKNIIEGPEPERNNPDKTRDFAVNTLQIPAEKYETLKDNAEFQNDLGGRFIDQDNAIENQAFQEKYNPSQMDKNISGQIPRKIDGSIDFASWLAGKGPEERKQMMKRLSDEEYDNYLIWKSTVNEGMKTALIRIENSNTIKEGEGKNLDTALIEKDKGCRNIQANIESTLNEKGKQEFEKNIADIKNNSNSTEYKDAVRLGFSETDIKSGAADGIIAGNYILNHGADFIRNGWIKEGEKENFIKSATDFAKVLGRDFTPPEGVQKYLENSMVSGERKLAVLEQVKNMSEGGKYKIDSATYNTQTGLIRFEDAFDKNKSAIIDTSTTPPSIEYRQGTLSIYHTLENEKPSPIIEQRQSKIDQINTEISEKKKPTIKNLLDSYGDPAFQDESKDNGSKIITSIQKLSFDDIQDPKKRGELVNQLENEKTRITSLGETGSHKDATLNERHKVARNTIIQTLQEYEDHINDIAKQIDQLPSVPEKKADVFEKNANDTLKELNTMGYGNLGSLYLDRLILALKKRDNGGGIWKNEDFDMQDSFTRKQQIDELRNIMEKLDSRFGQTGGEKFATIRKFTQNDDFRAIWKSPEKLSNWIQSQMNTSPSKIESPQSEAK